MKKILVDPGHGGDNPGAVATTGQREDRTNMNVADYLAQKLRGAGYAVIMTRTSHGQTVPLETRMRQIQKLKPDFVVSVHHNSAITPAANGAMCCVQVDGKSKWGKASRRFADIVAPFFAALGYKKLAPYFREQSDGRDYYGILRAAASVGIPAVITEAGYMSNAHDVSAMDTFKEQDAEAGAIFKAICQLDSEGLF